MRRVASLAVVLLSVAAGCGGSGDSASPAEALTTAAPIDAAVTGDATTTVESDNPAGCDSPSRVNGAHADNYMTSCRICQTAGPAEVAREYSAVSDHAVTVAGAYAATHRMEFRQAALDGCRRGFELR